jgi:hypothetical protein
LSAYCLCPCSSGVTKTRCSGKETPLYPSAPAPQDADKVIYARALSRFLDDVAAAEARLGRRVLCLGSAFNSPAARDLPNVQQKSTVNAITQSLPDKDVTEEATAAAAAEAADSVASAVDAAAAAQPRAAAPFPPHSLSDVPITLFSWSDRAELTGLTWPNLRLYCARWGLRFLPLSHAMRSLLAGRAPQWTKVLVAEQVLQAHQGGREGIYIWVDHDTVITNFTMDIRVSASQ